MWRVPISGIATIWSTPAIAVSWSAPKKCASPTAGEGAPKTCFYVLLYLPRHVLDLHGAGLGLGDEVRGAADARLLLADDLAVQDVLAELDALGDDLGLLGYEGEPAGVAHVTVHVAVELVAELPHLLGALLEAAHALVLGDLVLAGTSEGGEQRVLVAGVAGLWRAPESVHPHRF